MAEVNIDKLNKLVKGDNEITHTEAARQLNVTPGQLSMLVFNLAQVNAGVWKKIPSTPASVKKARDTDENRWELIAARTSSSVKSVKEMYEEAGGDSTVSVRGNGKGKSKSKTAAAKTKTKTTAAATPKRGRGRPAATTTRRARTLAERRASRGNPS